MGGAGNGRGMGAGMWQGVGQGGEVGMGDGYLAGGQGREIGFGRGCTGKYGVDWGWVLDSEQGKGCVWGGDGAGTGQMAWDAY